MSFWDSYRPVQNLVPDTRYRCSYNVVCLNSVTNADLTAALAEVGILTATPDLSGPLTGVLTGSTMDFMVERAMTVAEFSGLLSATYLRVTQNAWVECSTPNVNSVQELVVNGNVPKLPSTFGLGAVFALVVVAGIGIFIWRAK